MSDIENTKSLLNEQISFFRNKRKWNRFWTQVFVIGAASLSGAATIFIGVAEVLDDSFWSVFALVASGLATIVGVWQGVLGQRKLWHINNVALSDLYALERLIKRLESQGGIDSSLAKELGDSLELIIRKADTAWIEVYSPKEND